MDSALSKIELSKMWDPHLCTGVQEPSIGEGIHPRADLVGHCKCQVGFSPPCMHVDDSIMYPVQVTAGTDDATDMPR